MDLVTVVGASKSDAMDFGYYGRCIRCNAEEDVTVQGRVHRIHGISFHLRSR